MFLCEAGYNLVLLDFCWFRRLPIMMVTTSNAYIEYLYFSHETKRRVPNCKSKKKNTRTDTHDFARNAKSNFFASPVCSVNYHTSSKTIVCLGRLRERWTIQLRNIIRCNICRLFLYCDCDGLFSTYYHYRIHCRVQRFQLHCRRESLSRLLRLVQKSFSFLSVCSSLQNYV